MYWLWNCGTCYESLRMDQISAFFTWLGNWFCVAKNAKNVYYVPVSCTLVCLTRTLVICGEIKMNIVCKFSFYTMTVSTGLPFLPALLKTQDKESVKWKQNTNIFVHIDKYMVIFIKELSLSLTPVAHRLSDRTGNVGTPLDWSGDEVGRTSTDKECLEFLCPKGSCSPHDL